MKNLLEVLNNAIEKVEKLYAIVQDQHMTVDTLYEKIKSRKLQLNTKGYFSNKV